MELLNDILIKCNDCGNAMRIDKYELECETTSDERSMGYEKTYNFFADYDCLCCGNKIKVRIVGWEYPIGAFNYEDCKIFGGEFIQLPSLDIIYDYEFDDSVINYVIPTIENKIMSICNNSKYVYDLTPREFEEVVAEIFKKDGFEVELTAQTRDGGRDIIVKKMIKGSPFLMIIECKRYSEKNKVSVDIIRSLCGVQTVENANKAMVVTTSNFSEDAVNFANKRGTLIGLIDFDKFMEWIKEYSSR